MMVRGKRAGIGIITFFSSSTTLIINVLLQFYLLTNNITSADHEHMVKDAESVVVPLEFDTTLECVMNIEPDKFQWKFYRANDPYNPKDLIDLNQSNFILIPSDNYTIQRRQSELTIQTNSPQIAGDYQCLAHYGASVVASVPWHISIAKAGEFPKQNNTDVTIIEGNTVNWHCEPPLHSNPEPYIDYYVNGQYIRSSFNELSSKSLILTNVTVQNSGRYYCQATNVILNLHENSKSHLNLRVVRNGPPQAPFFIIPPQKTYVAVKGSKVFLECSAVGNPIPKSTWEKQNGQMPSDRVYMNSSLGGLVINNVTQSDEGVYICSHKNNYGSISQHITLIYNEEPSIDCLINSTDVKQGENLDLDCIIKGGIPEPQITWFLNGYNVRNDSSIEAIGNKIYFRPTEKRHAGNLQIFARNIVKTIYSSISIKVIPLSQSFDTASTSLSSLSSNNYNDNNNNKQNHGPTMKNHHRHNKPNSKKLPKHTKMIPPTKPIVSRLNDEAVVVRWSVPANKGLPILFFKVQYRELGPIMLNNSGNHRGNEGGGRKNNLGKGGRWKTTNADIPPHIGSYEVNNLKPDHIYRFRIAAVYSNNDNKLSQNSDKFLLRKMDFDSRNPLPVPIITHTETINSTAVKIYWKYIPQANNNNNISIDGFFINYISASSAADYMKATVDGESVNSYILTHLQPDTVYDIKLQSFTSKSASEFSAIMKAKTSPSEAITSTTTTTSTTNQKDTTFATTKTTNSENGVISKLYIIIAAAVIGGGLIIIAIILLVFCRKWKQKKNRDDHNKPAVDDHHIQVDSNDYVSSPKSGSRSNGCVLPSNRITITSNPLADAADNKNQNMIEMSCLSSQNNNLASPQPSVSGDGVTTGSSGGGDGNTINSESPLTMKKIQTQNIRNKNDANSMVVTAKSRENYV